MSELPSATPYLLAAYGITALIAVWLVASTLWANRSIKLRMHRRQDISVQ